jgi:hypothetical protein
MVHPTSVTVGKTTLWVKPAVNDWKQSASELKAVKCEIRRLRLIEIETERTFGFDR